MILLVTWLSLSILILSASGGLEHQCFAVRLIMIETSKPIKGRIEALANHFNFIHFSTRYFISIYLVAPFLHLDCFGLEMKVFASTARYPFFRFPVSHYTHIPIYYIKLKSCLSVHLSSRQYLSHVCID